MQSIEFATGDDDEEVSESISADQNGSANKGETLEQLLLARNKKLSNELTVLRVSHQDLQSRLSILQEELSDTNMELEKSRNLTATLESDLEKVQQEASNAFPSSAMSVAGTYTSRYPHSSFPSRRGRATSPTSSIISGFDPQVAPAGTPIEVLRSGEPVGGGSGILPMITAQRDRFKKKNSELESDLQKSYQNVASLRSEIASLQKDNLSLYEKTRYVSTFSRNNHSSSSTNAYSASHNPTTIQIGPSDNTDTRYKAAYESHISPFAAFRGRESARAVKRMSIPERAVFQITRMVLATRTSRNLFALYCAALHVLVLIMLYYMGNGDASMIVPHDALPAAGGPIAAGAALAKGADWHEEGFQQGG
jgi:homeobox protein cut-like